MISLCLLSCCSESSTFPKVNETGHLVINEFLASNDSTNTDEHGEYDDWVELYNGTDSIIDIAGMYITDDPLDIKPWQIPSTDPTATTIPPKGFLLLWCDEETDQGVLHVGIKLSRLGEFVILFESDRVTVIDSIQFGEMDTGISYGRETDGSQLWTHFSTPSPGSSN